VWEHSASGYLVYSYSQKFKSQCIEQIFTPALTPNNMAFIHNGKELSPCIVSKARHALGLKPEKPTNKKYCPLPYWEQAVQAVGERQNVEPETIAAAKASYGNYIKK
jgi:hypothetical protein